MDELANLHPATGLPELTAFLRRSVEALPENGAEGRARLYRRMRAELFARLADGPHPVPIRESIDCQLLFEEAIRNLEADMLHDLLTGERP